VPPNKGVKGIIPLPAEHWKKKRRVNLREWAVPSSSEQISSRRKLTGVDVNDRREGKACAGGKGSPQGKRWPETAPSIPGK